MSFWLPLGRRALSGLLSTALTGGLLAGGPLGSLVVTGGSVQPTCTQACCAGMEFCSCGHDHRGTAKAGLAGHGPFLAAIGTVCPDSCAVLQAPASRAYREKARDFIAPVEAPEPTEASGQVLQWTSPDEGPSSPRGPPILQTTTPSPA